MPKHPTSPPYKSALVISKSKDIKKHMTTIPKPIILSKWNSWNMQKGKDNRLMWYPSEYEKILDYLENRWKEIYNKSIDENDENEDLLFYVLYDKEKDITNPNSWKIYCEKQNIERGKKWVWKYNPKITEYLICVQRSDSMDESIIGRNLQGLRSIIEDALKKILCNS